MTDSEPRSDEEYIHASALESPVFTSDGGGIFSGSQHFVIAGGTFTNITNYVTAPAIPSDIRMIPMGDIYLQQQLEVKGESGVISWRGQRRCARQVYSAKIDGRTPEMTVAVYRGDKAEEAWRRDIALYMSLRHPNILQIWGGASAGNVRATVFHGDLVPFQQFTARYDHSPIMTLYILAYYAGGRQTSENLSSGLSFELKVVSSSDFTLWIRALTGRLSVDLEAPDSNSQVNLWEHHRILPTVPATNALLEANPEAVAIDSLTLEQYHLICQSLVRNRVNTLSPCATVSPGSIISGSSLDEYGNCVVVASVGPDSWWLSSWFLHGASNGGEVGEDGWTRYEAEDVSGTELYCCMQNCDGQAWLSQANHVFHCHQISFNFGAYVLVDKVSFRVTIPTITKDPLRGYLFLCPHKAFQTRPTSLKWPDCPAYWSLDPSGVERLTTEDAMCLGLPPVQLSTIVQLQSWDDSVYAGLRQIHRGKGFDPNSQDIARHFGYPLYQLSKEREFNHVNDEDSSTEAEDSAISQGLTLTMSVQLMLILFVTLCSVHDVVW